MKTALVTGGAGFIGHHLAHALLERGYRTRVLDDLSRGSHARLRDIADRIEFIEGSILDEAKLDRAVKIRRRRLPPRRLGLGAPVRRNAHRIPRDRRHRHAQAP
ncbi:MAG: NAD-dependent epimerase/dehydratase family protein [Anaeromyxobacter sp.]